MFSCECDQERLEIEAMASRESKGVSEKIVAIEKDLKETLPDNAFTKVLNLSDLYTEQLGIFQAAYEKYYRGKIEILIGGLKAV